MLIDSDKSSSQKPINDTKRRLQEEFDSGPGHAWITAGREIENYLTQEQILGAIASVHPTATVIGASDRYGSTLQIRTRSGKETLASKVEVARHVVANTSPNLDKHDLRARLEELVAFINRSNPTAAHT